MTVDQLQDKAQADMLALAERFPELRRECWRSEGRPCLGSGQVVEVVRPATPAGPYFGDRAEKAQGRCPECRSLHAVSKAGKLARHQIWDHLLCCDNLGWTLRPEAEWLGLMVRIVQHEELDKDIQLSPPDTGNPVGSGTWVAFLCDDAPKFCDGHCAATPEAALAAALLAALEGKCNDVPN